MVKNIRLTREKAEEIIESSKKLPHLNNSLKILDKCFEK